MKRALLLLALLAVPTAAPVRAQDAKPSPTSGCTGLYLDDREGDQTPPFLPAPGAGPQNMDIKAAWVRYLPGEKSPMRVNIQIADLDTEIAPGQAAHTYWFTWGPAESGMIVLAQLDSSGAWTYFQGTQSPDGFSIEGPTTGRVFPGPDGIVEIDIKQRVTKFSGSMEVEARYAQTDGGQPILVYNADALLIADEWSTASCAAAPAPAPAGSPAPTASGLGVTLGATSAKARGKRVAVTLNSSGPVTGLRARLLRRRTSVASGRLARLEGKGKLRLSGRRALRRGTYTLAVTGTNAQGQKASVRLRLRLR